MPRLVTCLLFVSACAGLLSAAPDDSVVFRSDVSLVRVDVQVLDRDNRTVTGLRASDFVLRDEGRVQPIRNFANENMPVDVLLLFDVSASMGPHVRRIANAAHQAMDVLTDKDRVGIMVFDRSTRVRLPFNGSRDEVERALDKMLREEHFSAGTDITRAMLDAADYAGSHGRRDARRAIVILTDDETEFERDEDRVGRALVRSDAVMMALIAPDAMASRTRGGGNYPGGNGGGGYPGGGSSRGPLGGIILGGGGMGGGRRGGGYPGGNGGSYGGPRTKSAGTAQIARDSGGDSMPVDDASALETTLSRIRQRYALYFLVPPGARQGQERNIEVALADGVRRHYADSDVRYRRTYISPGNGSTSSDTTETTTATANSDPVVVTPDPPRRRRAVSEPDGRGPSTSTAPSSASSTATDSSSSDTPRLRRAPDADLDRDPDRPVMRRAPAASSSDSNSDPDRPILKRADPSGSTTTTTKPADPATTPDPNAPPTGWRKAKPGEQQQQ